ncbi:hypothetical protein EWB00_008316 [Schistosoma japonicum]|uniref:Uncharacterized protein n=1 Tax=Schistosoma japonicum TaxID=6182 RepID=A0A4Z2CQS3_SCHJA|nr:hypothetical protein EWB00_008316 [Schistosoma japonicum]
MEQRVKGAVERLDHLHQRLVNYKPLLDQNVLNAEFEIRANFKNLMELLSKRQSSLLIQLHNIAKEKSMLIESNKQTIESLKCVLLQSCVTRNEMDAKVSDYIRQAETINLTSDLNPFVAFRVENTQLNEALSTFGRLASRYPGHFADPNKPSVCLPQAFEEEEEMRIGSSTHSSVFNRVKTTSSCPCNDPTLKQWLSSTEHKCKRKYSLDSISDMNILKEEEDSVGETEEETSVASQNNYFWLNKLSEKGSVQQYNFDFNTSHSAVRVPRYRPDSTMVRTWLELRDGQQHLTEPASYHREVHRYNNTFKSSDYSNKSISDSFDVLTNSSQNISSLKDWLFCDPAELRDMPGLSTNLHRNVINNIGSTNEYNNHQMNYSWLIPENVTLSIDTKMSTLSVDSSKTDNLTKKTNSLLLPDDLFKTGPIDLSRWLLKKSDNQLSVEQNQSVYDENDSTFQTNDEITTLNDVKQKVKVTDQSNVIVQSCPKFGICQGGPGGPTCCGGGCPLTSLMNLSKDSINPSLQQQQQQPTINNHDTTTSVVNASNEVNSLMCNNMSSVVNELIRIAQTDLKQWILNSPSVRSNQLNADYENRQQQQLDSVGTVTQNCLTSTPQTKSSDIDMQIDGENDEPDTLSNRLTLVSPPIDIHESKSSYELNKTRFPIKPTLSAQGLPPSYTNWLV